MHASTNAYGIYSFAKNAENSYGIFSKAERTGVANNIIIGAKGVFYEGGAVDANCAQGSLGYFSYGSENVHTTGAAGVVGYMDEKQRSQGEFTAAGYFRNEFRTQNGTNARMSALYGVYVLADGDFTTGTSSNADNYGVYAQAEGAYDDNWALFATVNDDNIGESYGLQAEALGTGATNYGVYASASGATTNYAGYFDGDVSVTNDVCISGDLYVVGTVHYDGLNQSTPTACPSDRRYKKEITPLQSSLERVLQVEGVNYFWRQNEFENKLFMNDREQTGVIAQDFELLFPELVNTNDEGFKSVNYAQYTAVLTEAMKEQQEIINTQQSEIEQLKSANTTLKTEVEQQGNDIEQIKKQIGISNTTQK